MMKKKWIFSFLEFKTGDNAYVRHPRVGWVRRLTSAGGDA